MTEREIRNNNYVVHNGENGDVDHTQKGKNPPGHCNNSGKQGQFHRDKSFSKFQRGHGGFQRICR